MASTLEQSSSVSQVQTTSHTVEATFKTALEAYARTGGGGGTTADTVSVTADSVLHTADEG